MPAEFAWLYHPVPLWVLIVALLTNPYQWSKRTRERIGPLLDRVLPPSREGGD